MFKKILILGIFAIIGCEESSDLPVVQDFAILSGGDDYDLTPTSCTLADPYETLALVRILDSRLVLPDPDCDVVETYFWLGYVENVVQVLDSTNPALKPGMKISMIEHRAATIGFPENDPGPYDAIFTLRNLNGVWVQGPKDGYAIKAGSKNTVSGIAFPTNWQDLKAEVLANQADYATECPSAEIVTSKDFEEWALTPGIKFYCSPDEVECLPGEVRTPSGECELDDGDDSN